MYRYGSSGGYRGRRRRSHRGRNLLIALVALLLAGTALAATGRGADLLNRVGLVGDPREQSQTADPTAGSTSVVASEGGQTESPTGATPTAGEGPDVTSTGLVPATEGIDAATVPPGVAGTGVPDATATKAPPPPTAKPSASPVETANAYLKNWQAGKYADMYKLLSKSARGEFKRDYFVERYTNITAGAAITSVEPKLGPDAEKRAQTQESLLSLPYTVKMNSALVGEFSEQNVLPLIKEDNVWRIQWSPSLIFKDLTADRRVNVLPYPTTRGNILDRSGKPLAVEGSIPELNIVPGEIKNEAQLLERVSKALGVSKQYVKDRYKNAGDPSWRMPIRALTPERQEQLEREIGDIPGVLFAERAAREYPLGEALAQVLGYVVPVSAEDLKKPEYRDYSPADVRGKGGLEEWGEQYLRGQIGGKISITTSDGAEEVRVVKEQPFRPGNNIYLNIDSDLQVKAEAELAGKVGATVAMDPNNGEILALVSEPSYDPNKFVIGISQEEFDKLNRKEANQPFVNRASGSSFPMASAFKPITMTAALAANLPKLRSRIWYSDGTWERLGEGDIRRDWKEGGHGQVNLVDGITESIDTVFYDLGFELYEKKYNYLSDHAEKWGLGKKFGVDGLVEAEGLVPRAGNPYPGWSQGDNVNLAIGQGFLRVSPLQAASVYSTIANGGTIYKPQLIRKIVAVGQGEKVIKEYKPQVVGKAPVKPEDMRLLQQALKTVTTAPNGTALNTFQDSPIPVAGKTGTGQQDERLPFAWFAGYAPADKPKVTVVTLAENAGEGSAIAAPIVRKVMEHYLKPPAARP